MKCGGVKDVPWLYKSMLRCFGHLVRMSEMRMTIEIYYANVEGW